MRTPNDLRLAKEATEIDLILGGHDHVYEKKDVRNYVAQIIKSEQKAQKSGEKRSKIEDCHFKHFDLPTTVQINLTNKIKGRKYYVKEKISYMS